MTIANILKSTTGEFEIGRVSLAIGGGFAVVTPVVFEILDMIHNGYHFDVTAWCVAYPGGLVALVAGGVFAIGNKEKQIAAARQTVAQPPLDDKTGASA